MNTRFATAVRAVFFLLFVFVLDYLLFACCFLVHSSALRTRYFELVSQAIHTWYLVLFGCLVHLRRLSSRRSSSSSRILSISRHDRMLRAVSFAFLRSFCCFEYHPGLLRAQVQPILFFSMPNRIANPRASPVKPISWFARLSPIQQ